MSSLLFFALQYTDLAIVFFFFSYMNHVIYCPDVYDYDRLFTRCTGCPAARPPACVCMNVDEDSVTGLEDNVMKISRVYYYYHVECPFFLQFFLSARDS